MKREDLADILYEIIASNGGRLSMMNVFKIFWEKYGTNLTANDDLFYTWNYDIRWAATKLRKTGKMKKASSKENSRASNESPKGIWEIIKK